MDNVLIKGTGIPSHTGISIGMSSSGGEDTICFNCNEIGTIVTDSDTSSRVCTYCGAIQSVDSFENQLYTSDGVRHYSLLSTTTDVPTYHDLKIYRAKTLITSIANILNLPRPDDVISLVSRVTDSRFALADSSFLPVLSAACCLVVARRNKIPVSLADAASAAACEISQVSRMLSRVLPYIAEDENYPLFNSAEAVSNLIRTNPKFSSSQNVEHMAGVASFLISCCAAKWCLSTGRRPMPLVAAVAAFVAEVYRIDVSLEDIAKSVSAAVHTTKLRLKELKEALVMVAKNLLPWGEDVDTKNLVHHVSWLIRLMQMKARSEHVGDNATLALSDEDFELDFSAYEEDRCSYFKGNLGEGEEDFERIDWDGLKKIKISEPSVSDAYRNVLQRIDQLRGSGGLGSSNQGGKRKKRNEISEDDLYMDFWELDNSLTLEQIMESDVGYDALPPSFVNGIQSREMRREKIRAAKDRIEQIKNPNANSDLGSRVLQEKPVGTKRKRKKKKRLVANAIDWEDCIIELLVLHGVNEEEIEQGHYSRLLDLHVFNSLSA